MNGDPRLIKQVKTIATNATKTVGTEKVILNGKVVELPKKNEWGFTGTLNPATGALNYDTTLRSSTKPYTQYSRGEINLGFTYAQDVTPFTFHTHSFASGASDRDWDNSGGDVYGFVVLAARNEVQIILPHGLGGYSGRLDEVFPGINK
jgi:hypothetical protein